MNTIGWAILAVGVMFCCDLQKLMVGREASDVVSGSCGIMFIGCIIMMLICTFKQNG